jgi:hypothetical protein
VVLAARRRNWPNLEMPFGGQASASYKYSMVVSALFPTIREF